MPHKKSQLSDQYRFLFYLVELIQNIIRLRDKNIIWLYLFLIATISDLFFLTESNPSIRIFSKPLILLSLTIYFFKLSQKISFTLLAKSILAALLFSLIGDILLLWPKLFVYGLGSFLMAHVCYIIGFRLAQESSPRLGQLNFIKAFLFNLPIYLAAIFVLYLILPNLGNLKIPVLTYILVIVSMVATARDRFKKCSPASFWQVYIGALLFFTSDGIIAINKFYQSFPESDVMIMGTYASGQLLIVMGIRSYLVTSKK